MSAIEKLRRPLDFAAKNDFQNLARVKGLGATLAALARSVPDSELPPAARAALLAALEGFDQAPEAERRARAERIKTLLDRPDRIPAKRSAPRRRPRDTTSSTPRPRRGPLDDLALVDLPGVGPKTAERLSRRGLDSVLDALLFLPRAYEDRRRVLPIAELTPGRDALVEGTVLHAGVARAGRRRMFEAVISDGSGTVSCRWFRFHPKAMEKRLARGSVVRLYGPVTAFGAMRQLVHPELEGAGASAPGLVPVYPEVEGVPPRTLRQLLERAAARHAAEVSDPLPEPLRARWSLPTLAEALSRAHLPTPADFEGGGPDQAAVSRLVFDELFFLQLALLSRRRELERERGLSHRSARPWPALASSLFPFELTPDQTQAFEEIRRDLEAPRAMNRLLLGDVGCGKTAVALLAAAWVKEAGRQTIILAPTEILAAQHHATAGAARAEAGLRVELLVGGVGAAERRRVLGAVRAGEVDVLIGTHALLEPDVEPARLGLVVIDEQHRFGVEQRARLRAKAKEAAPDVLIMTATPIPRTLALTAYGELDVSIIRRRPEGRAPVSTRLYRDEDRREAYRVVEAALLRGEQAYVVFPLVEESELASELKAATQAVSGLTRRFPAHRVGLLHGRMAPEEKARVMSAFRAGEVQLLVSTTVIEVGVDVPNATVLVLEHAERFGLAQVHQLRGRVGRGGKPGTCLLIAADPGREAWERLGVLERTSDGFVIAEEDLRIRGPGELLGTRQAGLPPLMMADLVRDAEVLERAREAARVVLAADPGLELAEHRALRLELERRLSGSLRLLDVG